MIGNDGFTNCCNYCHDLDGNCDDDDAYYDSCNDNDYCFDDLRMILTLEGFLHLSISRLTISRPPWLKVYGCWSPYLQQRANPLEKQELGNLWIQTPTFSPSEEVNVAQA